MAEKTDQGGADHFVPLIAEGLQPLVADLQKAPLAVDGMHHDRGFPKEFAVYSLSIGAPSATNLHEKPLSNGDQGSTRKVKDAYIYLTLPEGNVNGPVADYQTRSGIFRKGDRRAPKGFHA
jgi:hypothetical protein